MVIGYTSDTEYYEELGERLAGCDILIANCLKPEKDGIPDHLETTDVIRLLSDARPKLCVITHMGLKMLRVGAVREAEKIENQTGVRTIAAKDGQKIGEGLEKYF
jgi:ribonuclease BN (tRNA processing enzyme)